MQKRKAIFISVILLSLLLLSQPALGIGEGWLDGWTYRKSQEIEYAAGAGTNYQVLIDVNYGSGSDSGNSVYCDSKCQTDFDDIRFTEDDGETLLDYWIEEKTDSADASFWVEVSDDLSTVNVIIYMYYGNVGASTTSNGYDTFLSFANFDDSTTDGITERIGIFDNPSDYLRGISASGITWRKGGQYSNYAVACKIRNPTGSPMSETSIIARWDDTFNGADPTNMYMLRIASTTAWQLYERIGGWNLLDSGAGTYSVNTWYKLELRLDGTAITGFIDNADIGCSVSDNSLASGYSGGRSYSSSQYRNWDDFRIRKYQSSEPSCGDWGNEESLPSNSPFFSDVNETSHENGISTKLYSFWWIAEDDLSGYIFSWNYTGSWANETWSVFSATNNSWANVSKTLNKPLGTIIQWKTYGNSSENIWNITTTQSFTIQATITFYFTSAGEFWTNGTQKANTTSTAYTSPTVLNLQALPDSGYGFNSFNWSGSTTNNPYDFTVGNQSDIWCMFSALGVGGITVSYKPYIILGLFAFIILFLVAIASQK